MPQGRLPWEKGHVVCLALQFQVSRDLRARCQEAKSLFIKFKILREIFVRMSAAFRVSYTENINVIASFKIVYIAVTVSFQQGTFQNEFKVQKTSNVSMATASFSFSRTQSLDCVRLTNVESKGSGIVFRLSSHLQLVTVLDWQQGLNCKLLEVLFRIQC